MSGTPGVIYEVTLSIEQTLAAELDSWLEEHIAEMLSLPGFIEAHTYTLDDEGGRARRVTQYLIDNEADLEHYLAGPAAGMRKAAVDRFGNRVDAQRRVLHPAATDSTSPAPVEHCPNCNAVLAGQYCANCGQRSRSRLISLWELISDAFGDVFELDSRLWRTLVPLFFRPGRLTRDYLEGRRARFMPPFRTYLVLSIIFFLVAFFDPRKDLEILFEPDTQGSEQTTGDDAAKAREEVLKDLADEGVIVSDEVREKLEAQDEDGLEINASKGTLKAKCEFDDLEQADLPGWLKRRLTRERLQHVCDRVIADDGRQFLAKVGDNVPTSLFVLLPLMALVLQILYPLSKRYYVEHLLFVVHFHAFLFLILTLQLLFARIGTLVRIPEFAINMSIVAVSFYIPVYLYKAMRRVYGQGHLSTIVKFLLLAIAYLFGLVLVMLFAALYAAFTL